LPTVDALLPGSEVAAVIADKACDVKERVIARLQGAGKKAVIPSRRNSRPPLSSGSIGDKP